MCKKGKANNQALALLGGSPVCSESLSPPQWPPVSAETANRLHEVYLSRQWSFNSPSEQEFERNFAAFHGAKHGVFMMNGTVTLQCALSVMGIGSGDEVIVPGLTWIATAMAVHYVGATPVFVDVEPDTLCIDPIKAAKAVTASTRAIIPVHLYGSMSNLDAILELARKHDLTVIEDCAHMHGGKWRGRGVGSWGDIGSFSFQQSKTLSSGEGGICLTNNDELADRLYRMKHIGYGRGMKQGKADAGPPPGLKCCNFRSTAFQATILSGQLSQLEHLIERYEASAARIRNRLAHVPGVRTQVRGKEASPQGYYSLVFIFDEGPISKIPANSIREAIFAEGLACAMSYGPVYRHMLYKMDSSQYRIDGGETCPVAESAGAKHAVCLPHQWLASDANIVDTIGEIIAKVTENAEFLREYVSLYSVMIKMWGCFYVDPIRKG